MKRYRITLQDQAFDVKILDDPRQEQVRVEVDGEILTVGVETVAVTTSGEIAPTVAPPPATPTLAPQGSARAGNTIAAPLPGVVKSIIVRPGQQVAAGDKVVVIEAMKMDNVIRAPRGGAISTIHVVEGRQVAYGDPLLELTDQGEEP
jgi:biotin carboxyl carrier protein